MKDKPGHVWRISRKGDEIKIKRFKIKKRRFRKLGLITTYANAEVSETKCCPQPNDEICETVTISAGTFDGFQSQAQADQYAREYARALAEQYLFCCQAVTVKFTVSGASEAELFLTGSDSSSYGPIYVVNGTETEMELCNGVGFQWTAQPYNGPDEYCNPASGSFAASANHTVNIAASCSAILAKAASRTPSRKSARKSSK
jgi:hypothetical protein